MTTLKRESAPPGKYRVVSDGHFTRIFDDQGLQVRNVVGLRMSQSPGEPIRLYLELLVFDVETEIRGEVLGTDAKQQKEEGKTHETTETH